MTRLVWDIEILKPIEELAAECDGTSHRENGGSSTCTGWGHTDKMGIACAGVYEYESDTYEIYTTGQEAELRRRLEAADVAIGFNSWEFDYRVAYAIPRIVPHPLGEYLAQVGQGGAVKHRDLLQDIWRALRSVRFKGYGLDAVGAATLGKQWPNKEMEGALAPIAWRNGQYGQVVTYNIGDLRRTRLLSDFIDTHGYIIDPNSGQRLYL